MRENTTDRIVKAWCEDYNKDSSVDRLEWYDISTETAIDSSGKITKMIIKFDTDWCKEEREIDFNMYIRDIKIQDSLGL